MAQIGGTSKGSPSSNRSGNTSPSSKNTDSSQKKPASGSKPGSSETKTSSSRKGEASPSKTPSSTKESSTSTSKSAQRNQGSDLDKIQKAVTNEGGALGESKAPETPTPSDPKGQSLNDIYEGVKTPGGAIDASQARRYQEGLNLRKPKTPASTPVAAKNEAPAPPSRQAPPPPAAGGNLVRLPEQAEPQLSSLGGLIPSAEAGGGVMVPYPTSPLAPTPDVPPVSDIVSKPLGELATHGQQLLDGLTGALTGKKPPPGPPQQGAIQFKGEIPEGGEGVPPVDITQQPIDASTPIRKRKIPRPLELNHNSHIWPEVPKPGLGHEVAIGADGRFMLNGQPFDTDQVESKGRKDWTKIAMTPDRQIRVDDGLPGADGLVVSPSHREVAGTEQVAFAGEGQFHNGQLTALTEDSGHYKTTHTMTSQFLRELNDRGVDLSNVQVIAMAPETQDFPEEDGWVTRTEYVQQPPVSAQEFLSKYPLDKGHFRQLKVDPVVKDPMEQGPRGNMGAEMRIQNGKFMAHGAPVDTSESSAKDHLGRTKVVITGDERQQQLYFDDGTAAKQLHLDPSHADLVNHADAIWAGEMAIKNGVLRELSENSGHYHPSHASTMDALRLLDEKGVDLSQASIETMNLRESTIPAPGGRQQPIRYWEEGPTLSTQEFLEKYGDLGSYFGS